MRLQSSVLFLLLFLGLSSLEAEIQNPEEMTTQEIYNELKNNNQEMMNSSDKIWNISVESRKESETSKEELEKSKETLNELSEINAQLEMNQSEQSSLVTAMTDFSMSLNRDLEKERKKVQNRNKVIVTLVAVSVIEGFIIALK